MKDNPTTFTPKLRFPEFKSPWELKSIGPYVEECSSRVPAPTLLPIYTCSRTGLKPQEDYYGGRTIINDGEYGVVPPECFVFRHMSDDGRFAFHTNETGGDIAVSKEYPVFRAVGIDRHFLLAKLNHSSDFKAFALSQKAGGTRTRLYFSRLRTWETLLPSSAEQRKIAECLTSLDEWIAAEGRKREALRAHKKGLMQRLFPRDGETRPRLRFPEFRDAPEWEDKRLEDLAQRGSGHTPNKGQPEYYNGGIKWVSLADSKRLDRGLISETEIEISEQGVENSSAVLHKEGSVILSRDAGVGKSAVMACQMAVSQHFIVWTCDPRKLSNWFLYHLLQKTKPLFERIATGSTIKTIGLPFFIGLRVTVPSVPEQERIAACLSSLDEMIAAQSRKLDGLHVHKKGLIQQLFPQSEGL